MPINITNTIQCNKSPEQILKICIQRLGDKKATIEEMTDKKSMQKQDLILKLDFLEQLWSLVQLYLLEFLLLCGLMNPLQKLNYLLMIVLAMDFVMDSKVNMKGI